jgi:diaminopimelate epimerase
MLGAAPAPTELASPPGSSIYRAHENATTARQAHSMTHPLSSRPVLKMNGIGNEILVLDLRGSDAEAAQDDVRAIAADPKLGFDQLMALHDPRTPGAAAFMRIYNTDGSLSSACGNGARCVAWALASRGQGGDFLLETDAGLISARRVADVVFEVDMGRPRLGWRDIPLSREASDTSSVALAPPVQGAPERFSAVSMGNPHAVFFVEDVRAIDLATLGPALERHSLFPQRANISFAQIVDDGSIILRTWERGAGATRACGSAACAALVASARAGLTGRKAAVRLPGGVLQIEWREDDHVLMTGPVEFEFETTLDPALFEKATT